jgi:predicted ATPase
MNMREEELAALEAHRAQVEEACEQIDRAVAEIEASAGRIETAGNPELAQRLRLRADVLRGKQRELRDGIRSPG